MGCRGVFWGEGFISVVVVIVSVVGCFGYVFG